MIAADIIDRQPPRVNREREDDENIVDYFGLFHTFGIASPDKEYFVCVESNMWGLPEMTAAGHWDVGLDETLLQDGVAPVPRRIPYLLCCGRYSNDVFIKQWSGLLGEFVFDTGLMAAENVRWDRAAIWNQEELLPWSASYQPEPSLEDGYYALLWLDRRQAKKIEAIHERMEPVTVTVALTDATSRRETRTRIRATAFHSPLIVRSVRRQWKQPANVYDLVTEMLVDTRHRKLAEQVRNPPSWSVGFRILRRRITRLIRRHLDVVERERPR